ncbi:MAG: hypothetical protein EOM40_17135 [Clostridia bacterium]|nr:hypothetical protein [Clostridia bacterium]
MKKISEKSQKAYQKYIKNREHQFDFEHADVNTYWKMTKNNTNEIEACARKYWEGIKTEEKLANGVSIEIITLQEADPEQYIYYYK